MIEKVLNDFENNEELIAKLEEAGKRLAEADPTLSPEDLQKAALKELGYDLSEEEFKSLFEQPSGEMDLEDMAQVSGGVRTKKNHRNSFGESVNYCPVHGEAGHKFEADGQCRGTTNIFYKTEEHYVCACGKGYWDAGLFSFRHWD